MTRSCELASPAGVGPVPTSSTRWMPVAEPPSISVSSRPPRKSRRSIALPSAPLVAVSTEASSPTMSSASLPTATTRSGVSSRSSATSLTAMLGIMLIDDGRRLTTLRRQRGDDAIGKYGRRHFGRPGHLAREIVGDVALLDGLFDSTDDHLRYFGPAEILEHHHSGQDDAAGIDAIGVRVL